MTPLWAAWLPWALCPSSLSSLCPWPFLEAPLQPPRGAPRACPPPGLCGLEVWVQGVVGPPRRPPGARTPAPTGSPRGTPRSRRRSAPSAGAPQDTGPAAPGGSRAGAPRARPPWPRRAPGQERGGLRGRGAAGSWERG